MGGLRVHGIVSSVKGHGGGWRLIRPLAEVTMLDVYEALGEPTLFALGPAAENPSCLVERAVDARLGDAFARAAEALRGELRATTLQEIAEDFERRMAAVGIGVVASDRVRRREADGLTHVSW